MGLADGSRSSSERNSAHLSAPYPPRPLVSGHDLDAEVDHVKDSESMQSLDHAHAGEWCWVPPLRFCSPPWSSPTWHGTPSPLSSLSSPFVLVASGDAAALEEALVVAARDDRHGVAEDDKEEDSEERRAAKTAAYLELIDRLEESAPALKVEDDEEEHGGNRNLMWRLLTFPRYLEH